MGIPLPAAIASYSKETVYLYFSVSTEVILDRNLSHAAWTSGVKSLGKWAATEHRMQWESSCKRKEQEEIKWNCLK